MKRKAAVVVLKVAVLALLVVRLARAEKTSLQQFPDAYTEKVDSIADMMQTDPAARLPNGGRSHCAPVAVSNSLMWLAENGFENFAPGLGNRREAHFELARILGSKEYMNTNLKAGTGAGGLLDGLARYIEDKGYECRYLKFEGWRKHPERFSLGEPIPDLDWIKDGIVGNSAVWLNIGWYEYDPWTWEYTRIGGHWVTLVGYGADEKGKADPAILVIHDPAPRCGNSPHEYVRMELIDRGRLVGNQNGLPRPANGYYKMTDGMHVKKGADFGILDGAVVLKMNENVAGSQP